LSKKNYEQKPGYGKLLDAWVAPDESGDPIGCLATTFTFSPVFFEEECLARFLQLESDPTEDGPVYLVEREEKLAQVTCASALVDQLHCQGSRSLRWDLLSARMPRGIQHSKVSLLFWSKLIRIIIGSANLTEDGYRRNQEVFGVLDFKSGGDSPLSCLVDTVAFLREAASFSNSSASIQSPAFVRWNLLLDRAFHDGATWGLSNNEVRLKGIRVQTIFSGPGRPSIFASLKSLWPGGSPPDSASVLSPFFDPPESPNTPARELWGLIRQRGDATVEFHVAAEDIPGEDGVFLYAPKSLLDAQPSGRANLATDFYRVVLSAGRSLHAKGIWLEDQRWSVYEIGSSNFTSAGTGIGKAPNLEANLVYIVDSKRDPKARKLLEPTFPESEYVDIDGDVKWKPLTGEGEDAAGVELPLPDMFGDAIYNCDEKNRASVTLSIVGSSHPGWEVLTEGDDQLFLNEEQWLGLQQPTSCELKWEANRPPSGFWVRWSGSSGSAWWPVNVLGGNVLPPPDELKNLPLEVLINILSSARPLHRVLYDYIRRRDREKGKADAKPVVDPHKRVDTSQFLLQRTRRISWALNALRERLERPVVTIEFLKWRLHGPVGVMALAKALIDEAQSSEERVFLISELALELARVKPNSAPGCVPPEQHTAEINGVINELKALVPNNIPGEPENLRRYVESVFKAVSV
jgi:hypothetical protein